MTVGVLENLGLLAEAPYGIRRMRELILELAVAGRLVPQDVTDESGEDLLARIGKLSASLKKGKQTKSGGFEPNESNDPLPSGWAAAQLGDVVEIVRGITFPASEKTKTPAPGRIACLRTANVQDQVEWDDLLYVGKEFVGREDQVLQVSDIVISMANSRELVGKVALVTDIPVERASFGGFLGVIRPILMEPRFVMALLRTPGARRELIDGASQTTNIANISLAKLRPLPVAVPPLAEQHRIVAKVDELMALCDRLEARQQDAEAAHARLVQALLDSLTQARDAEEFQACWQRLAGQFPALFTTEGSVDALASTVLELAISGWLVSASSEEEPAAQLLREVASVKAKLVDADGLRTTARNDVPAEEHYLPLPRGWSYARIGNLARFIDYRGRTPVKTMDGVPLITAKNVRPGYISREPREFIAAEEFSAWMTRGLPRVGDMLFTTEAPLGNVALIDIDERFALAQRVICFQLHRLDMGPYLRIAFMSRSVQRQILDMATGMTAAGVKASRLKELPLPIPPLGEQHRIVAKVTELLALCDQLKARIAAARAKHAQLAEALVAQAVAT